MSANREDIGTDRSAADDEAGSAPLGSEAPDQTSADHVTGGERTDAVSVSDLGPDPGSGDDAPRRGEVF